MNIVTDTVINVYSDSEYHYSALVSDEELGVTYTETDGERKKEISFGSIEEMEAVANAMLRAVRTHRGY
jgi:hypothetical protein